MKDKVSENTIKDACWQAFLKSGKIGYYMLYNAVSDDKPKK